MVSAIILIYHSSVEFLCSSLKDASRNLLKMQTLYVLGSSVDEDIYDRRSAVPNVGGFLYVLGSSVDEDI